MQIPTLTIRSVNSIQSQPLRLTKPNNVRLLGNWEVMSNNPLKISQKYIFQVSSLTQNARIALIHKKKIKSVFFFKPNLTVFIF